MAVRFTCFALAALFIVILFQASFADAQTSPAPAPASDGTTLDQGIAYVLMFAALVVTYIVHPIGSLSLST
ncbi:hypothetical protein KP509_05G029100 [Ceratopteris richardii]|uniref:Uncharacterized protein n=1 Tax=Ceratopteris richardii TaxID=49495 RepID=A0A8T2UKF6_CERRI|nr:hypothetical protein KP509_05G029100 [Ceratopteris richardii]